MSPVRSQKVHTTAFLHTLAGSSPCGLWDPCTGRPLLEAAPSKQDADSSLLCAGGAPSKALQGPLASLLLSLQASNQYIFFNASESESSGDSGHTVVVVHGVQRAADAVGGQRVAVLAHHAADDAHQNPAVLLPQQAVHKWVGGGFGIGETLGRDAPVARNVHEGQQFHQPAVRGREKKMIL